MPCLFASLPSVAGGTQCARREQAATPLPALLWVFTESLQICALMHGLNSHSLSTYYMPVPHNRGRNDKDRSIQGKGMPAGVEVDNIWNKHCTASPCDVHGPSVMGTQGGGQGWGYKESCHVFGSSKAAKERRVL